MCSFNLHLSYYDQGWVSFIFLREICISLSVNCLYLLPFFYHVIAVLINFYKLSVLGILALFCNISCKYFSCLVFCLFTLLQFCCCCCCCFVHLLQLHKVYFYSNVLKFIYLLLYCCLILSIVRKVFLIQGFKVVQAYLFQYSNGFTFCIQVSDPFGIYLSVWCEERSKFHIFPFDYPAVTILKSLSCPPLLTFYLYHILNFRRLLYLLPDFPSGSISLSVHT